MVNVDLLIKNNKKQTLLTCQNTVKAKPGWHLPGGIVRLGETLNERVRKVGLIELGVKVKNISLKPIDFKQIILNQDNRSHFFSFSFFL